MGRRLRGGEGGIYCNNLLPDIYTLSSVCGSGYVRATGEIWGYKK